MPKYCLLVSGLFFSIPSFSIYAATPTITISDDKSTVTYEGGSINGGLIQNGDIKKLVVKGTEVIDGKPATSGSSKGAAISLGGVNGSDKSRNNYGNLEVEVDKNTLISVTNRTNIAGIYVRTDTADSLAKVTSGATMNIHTTASFPQGVVVENKGGDGEINLTKDSSITTTGVGGMGASISVKGKGKLISEGSLTLNGDYGVALSILAATGTIKSTGTITTTGLSNIGISLNAQGSNTDLPSIIASGSITIGKDTGGTIVNGINGSQGISLTSANQGGGNVVYNDKQNSITINAGSKTSSRLSSGISSTNTGGGNNYITATMKSIDVTGDNSAAIIAEAKGGEKGSILVRTKGDMTIKGGNTLGISAVNTNTAGVVSIDHSGDITMKGSNAPNLLTNVGITASSMNTTAMVNVKGNMDIQSNNAIGVSSSVTNKGSSSIVFGDTSKKVLSSLNIESLGDSKNNKLIGLSGNSSGKENSTMIQVNYVSTLKVSGEGDTLAISANADKDSSAIVTVSKTDAISATSTTGNATAISATATGNGAGLASVIVNSGTDVKASSTNGVATAINLLSNGTQGTSVTIMNAKSILADSTDGVAIKAVSTTGDNTVSLFGSTLVQGGSGANGAGIDLTSTTGKITLNNIGATIASNNDLALTTHNAPANSSTDILNMGKIIGYVTLNGGNVTFNNEQGGVFALQDFGANGSNKGTSTSTIGTDNQGIFNNRGTIEFGDKNFLGPNSNTTSHAIINTGTFNNSGIIDLTNGSTKTNTAAHSDYIGNTLTINGNYVSEGGQLIVNTFLGKDQTVDGKSDQLIINGDVTTGTGGSTLVTIRPTQDSINTLITNPNHGIKIVEVNGTSSNDAFKLNSPVLAGRYEYTLSQPDYDPTDPNYSWYLSNKAIGGASHGTSPYNINPSIGAYLNNQTIATEMFQMSLFDRLIASNGATDDAEQKFLWYRTKITHEGHRSVGDALTNRSHTYMAQMGGDLAVLKLTTGYLHLGVMAGYGDHKNESTSRNTRTKAEGKVKGYNLGGYATYFANRDTQTGLYIDTWTEMSQFRNKVEGKGLLGTQHYNSSVWSSSIEAGYGLSIAHSKQYEWLVTPQQQFIYNLYDADNQHDRNGLSATDNKASGLVSRTGIRLHARGIQKSMLEPFVEVNWVNFTAKNQLKFNGQNERDGTPRNRYEAKVGVQGNINSQWSLSGEVGGLWGENKYNSYQAQLNVNYHF